MNDKKEQKLKLATRVIHGGVEPDPLTGAVMTPIYATSTYAQERPGCFKGYEYSRTGNPTRHAFESAMTSIEDGHSAYAFGSGMAAIATCLELLDSGDHIIAMDDLYGGTHRLFKQVRTRSSGLQFSFVDFTNLDAIAAAVTPDTKMLWVESPSNPMLKVVDLAAIAEFAHKHNLIAVCDNTFATPIIQQPLTLGFDIVTHSVTKYISGHSDCVAGVVVVNSDVLAEKMAYLQNSVGAILGPFDSYLALRGLKTLNIRMQRHSDNAMKIVQWLQQQNSIDTIYYPGLETHTSFPVAKQQMKLFGGMISFCLNANYQQTIDIISSTKLITLAESLGGVESLIEHPASMTHASVDADIRQSLGISDSLIRLSVGIEDPADLIDDLQQAISGVLG